MRIHVYRDTQVAERVLRRWEQFGVARRRAATAAAAARRTTSRGTADDPLLTGRATEVYYQAATRLRGDARGARAVLNGLATAKGRKSVILVSEGFIHDINLEEFRRVNEASRRSNAAIYFLNSRGLEGMPSYMTAEFGPAIPDQDVGALFAETLDAVAGADDLAADSGGFTVRNTNDLNQGIQRIASETQAYYLLGYTPSNTARDGKFRKIQVKLAEGKGKGLQVRARKGYFAPSDVARTAGRQEGRRPGDPERARLAVGPGRHAAADDALHRRREGPRQGRGGRGRPTSTCGRSSSRRRTGGTAPNCSSCSWSRIARAASTSATTRAVNMKLLPATRQRLAWQWYPIAREFELRPGRLPGEDRGPRRALARGGHGHARVRGAPARQLPRGDAGARRQPAARPEQHAGAAR